MTHQPALPPGQRARKDFPRFGLTPYATRFPARPADSCLVVAEAGLDELTLAHPFAELARVEQRCDFHCVTTWSCRGLLWSGVRFADFYRHQVVPRLRDAGAIRSVLLRAQDGYRTTLPLADLLAADVLLADRLDGVPLGVEHGAPLRLVAPAHYGYKSVKHLARLEFWPHEPPLRNGAFGFIDHPRGRVAHEERARVLPGWLLRWLYRPLVPGTVRRFGEAMRRQAG